MWQTILTLIKNNWLRFLLGGLAAIGVTITLSSCGVTSARISRPAEGTTTTVTITTNNPITTNVEPNLDLNTK